MAKVLLHHYLMPKRKSTEDPVVTNPIGAQGLNSVKVSELLSKLQANSSTSNTNSSDGNGSSRSFKVEVDPRVKGIQTNLIRRYQQEYLVGVAEGRSGENPEAQLGSGPRKTISCLDTPLKFKGGNTTQHHRKTRTQRLLESGQITSALQRARKHMFHSRPGTYRDPRRVEYDANDTSTQVGLGVKSRKAYGSLDKNERRLDAVSL